MVHWRPWGKSRHIQLVKPRDIGINASHKQDKPLSSWSSTLSFGMAKSRIEDKKLTELTYLTTLPDDSELSCATLATTLRLLILPAPRIANQIMLVTEEPKCRGYLHGYGLKIILPDSLGGGSRGRLPGRFLLPHGTGAAAGWTTARAQAIMSAHPWESSLPKRWNLGCVWMSKIFECLASV